MTPRTRPLALVAALAILLVLLFVAERTVALVQRVAELPALLQWLVGAVLVLFVLAGAWLGWILLRPRPRRAPAPVDRADIDRRLEVLEEHGAAAAELRAELATLDARRDAGELHVALFGEISAGKSSLVRALAPQAAVDIDVVGGSTHRVEHFAGTLPGGRGVLLADVPGTREQDGEAREALARNEALQAHVVVYVTAGDLTRQQVEELRWLGEFGKPVLLVLNKVDQWQAGERDQLLARLREAAGPAVDLIVSASAGGEERFRRELPDGRVESVQRARRPEVAELQAALEQLVAPGAAALEAARERAVLAGLHQRLAGAEAGMREAEALRIVARYTRRAIVGALAAIAPGSDLVIQGVLATAMTRELGRLFDIPVNDIEIEALLRQARLNLRTSATVVLAIAGNAMKAFPGLGTLGGGVAHAFAYALVFDSLGKALAATMRERRTLDVAAAGAELERQLADGSGARLRRLAALTVDALRHPDAAEREEPAP